MMSDVIKVILKRWKLLLQPYGHKCTISLIKGEPINYYEPRNHGKPIGEYVTLEGAKLAVYRACFPWHRRTGNLAKWSKGK